MTSLQNDEMIVEKDRLIILILHMSWNQQIS